MQGSRALTDDEIKSMLESTDPRYKTLVMTGIMFGTRISEALELRFSDFESRTLRIKSKKGSNNQEFPIPGTYREALNELKRFYEKHDVVVERDSFVFVGIHPNSGGKVLTRQAANESLRVLSRKLGLDGKVSFHSFRKSFVTKIYEKTNYNIAETKKYSRHKSLANLEYYIRTTDSMDLVDDDLWGVAA